MAARAEAISAEHWPWAPGCWFLRSPAETNRSKTLLNISKHHRFSLSQDEQQKVALPRGALPPCQASSGGDPLLPSCLLHLWTGHSNRALPRISVFTSATGERTLLSADSCVVGLVDVLRLPLTILGVLISILVAILCAHLSSRTVRPVLRGTRSRGRVDASYGGAGGARSVTVVDGALSRDAA